MINYDLVKRIPDQEMSLSSPEKPMSVADVYRNLEQVLKPGLNFFVERCQSGGKVKGISGYFASGHLLEREVFVKAMRYREDDDSGSNDPNEKSPWWTTLRGSAFFESILKPALIEKSQAESEKIYKHSIPVKVLSPVAITSPPESNVGNSKLQVDHIVPPEFDLNELMNCRGEVREVPNIKPGTIGRGSLFPRFDFVEMKLGASLYEKNLDPQIQAAVIRQVLNVFITLFEQGYSWKDWGKSVDNFLLSVSGEDIELLLADFDMSPNQNADIEQLKDLITVDGEAKNELIDHLLTVHSYSADNSIEAKKLRIEYKTNSYLVENMLPNSNMMGLKVDWWHKFFHYMNDGNVSLERISFYEKVLGSIEDMIASLQDQDLNEALMWKYMEDWLTLNEESLKNEVNSFVLPKTTTEDDECLYVIGNYEMLETTIPEQLEATKVLITMLEKVVDNYGRSKFYNLKNYVKFEFLRKYLPDKTQQFIESHDIDFLNFSSIESDTFIEKFSPKANIPNKESALFTGKFIALTLGGKEMNFFLDEIKEGLDLAKQAEFEEALGKWSKWLEMEGVLEELKTKGIPQPAKKKPGSEYELDVVAVELETEELSTSDEIETKIVSSSEAKQDPKPDEAITVKTVPAKVEEPFSVLQDEAVKREPPVPIELEIPIDQLSTDELKNKVVILNENIQFFEIREQVFRKEHERVGENKDLESQLQTYLLKLEKYRENRTALELEISNRWARDLMDELENNTWRGITGISASNGLELLKKAALNVSANPEYIQDISVMFAAVEEANKADKNNLAEELRKVLSAAKNWKTEVGAFGKPILATMVDVDKDSNSFKQLVEDYLEPEVEEIDDNQSLNTEDENSEAWARNLTVELKTVFMPKNTGLDLLRKAAIRWYGEKGKKEFVEEMFSEIEVAEGSDLLKILKKMLNLSKEWRNQSISASNVNETGDNQVSALKYILHLLEINNSKHKDRFEKLVENYLD